MGYHVEYERIGNIPIQKQRKWTSILASVMVILLVLGAVAIKTVGLEWVQEVLLPGDPDITAAALGNLVEDLRSGESIIEAFTTFCEEIIDSAGVE